MWLGKELAAPEHYRLAQSDIRLGEWGRRLARCSAQPVRQRFGSEDVGRRFDLLLKPFEIQNRSWRLQVAGQFGFDLEDARELLFEESDFTAERILRREFLEPSRLELRHAESDHGPRDRDGDRDEHELGSAVAESTQSGQTRDGGFSRGPERQADRQHDERDEERHHDGDCRLESELPHGGVARDQQTEESDGGCDRSDQARDADRADHLDQGVASVVALGQRLFEAVQHVHSVAQADHDDQPGNRELDDAQGAAGRIEQAEVQQQSADHRSQRHDDTAHGAEHERQQDQRHQQFEPDDRLKILLHVVASGALCDVSADDCHADRRTELARKELLHPIEHTVFGGDVVVILCSFDQEGHRMTVGGDQLAVEQWVFLSECEHVAIADRFGESTGEELSFGDDRNFGERDDGFDSLVR